MKIASITDRVALHNGVQMPWLGLGVFRAQEGEEVIQAIQWAVECGYRSIDTATVYGNEEGVGRAVQACGVPREELFITTKVWNTDQGYDNTLHAFDASLKRLGLDTIDLYLVHWPVKGLYQDTWRALEHLYTEGRVRAIGVSNFLEHHLDTLMTGAVVTPMVNQVEFHPRLRQPGLMAKCADLGIRLEAWSPIMRGKVDDIPELCEIAAHHGKTPTQVTLRWDLQQGVVTIPKSVRRERIVANAALFDFELSAEEMTVIDALDRNERHGPDPDTF